MRLPIWHRTKIVCTLGPATDPPGVVERLVGAGMDIARVNLSHGSHIEHARRIAEVRHAAQQVGQPVGILADLPGPKFRLGTLAQGARILRAGTSVMLSTKGDGADLLPVRNQELLSVLHVGSRVYLADGSIELLVTESGTEHVTCEVLIGAEVRSGSGINAPEAVFENLVPTDEDRRHLSFALSQGAEWVGVSFVQRAEDLARLRACFSRGTHALLMAKIEKRRAIEQLDAIIESADGVMVARGDLGVETDIAEIPLLQKRIIAAANTRGRPVVTATQMLESMVQNEHPTRAEVTDVANAVLDGTDAVMLSGETAIGHHPVAAVEILSRVLAATEAEHAVPMGTERLRASIPEVGEALSFVACQLAGQLSAGAIIVKVEDIATAASLARFRPAAPLIVFAESEVICRGLTAVRGVAPLYSLSHTDDRRCAEGAQRWLAMRGLVSAGCPAVLLSSSNLADRELDTLRVVRL